MGLFDLMMMIMFMIMLMIMMMIMLKVGLFDDDDTVYDGHADL